MKSEYTSLLSELIKIIDPDEDKYSFIILKNEKDFIKKELGIKPDDNNLFFQQIIGQPLILLHRFNTNPVIVKDSNSTYSKDENLYYDESSAGRAVLIQFIVKMKMGLPDDHLFRFCIPFQLIVKMKIRNRF